MDWIRNGPAARAVFRVCALACLAAGLALPGGGPRVLAAGEPVPARVSLRFYPGRGGDFALTDQHGQVLDTRLLRGQVMLLAFGYTTCPDICPATLALLTLAQQHLGADQDAVQLLFVTLDPEQDTPERLAEYLTSINPRIIGMTGSGKEIRAVARKFQVKFEVREGTAGRPRTIDHTAFVYLIDRYGRLRYVFPHTSPPSLLAEGARELIQEAR